MIAIELGWIDFSEEDKKNITDALSSLTGPGVTDELGIGVIRDAYSNIFFPALNTVQTRAKYFLLVPYIMRETVRETDMTDPDSVLMQIDKRERQCAAELKNKGGGGVIGQRNLPFHWVQRTPSSIYWNGIKELKIFNDSKMSERDYIRLALECREAEKAALYGNNDDREDESDRDDDAGLGASAFWDLPLPGYSSRGFDAWLKELQISLLPEEAAYLRRKIETELSGSLFAFLLRGNIKLPNPTTIVSTLELLQKWPKSRLPKEMLVDMQTAADFAFFMLPAFIQYNLLISNDKNENAMKEWQKIKKELPRYGSFDFETMLTRIGRPEGYLINFLAQLRTAYSKNDAQAIRTAVKNREISLKGINRAKTAKPDDSYKDRWFGLLFLDYRLPVGATMLNDIYDGESTHA